MKPMTVKGRCVQLFSLGIIRSGPQNTPAYLSCPFWVLLFCKTVRRRAQTSSTVSFLKIFTPLLLQRSQKAGSQWEGCSLAFSHPEHDPEHRKQGATRFSLAHSGLQKSLRLFYWGLHVILSPVFGIFAGL